MEIEALKSDCANAQLECNAADGRAKLLASDAIGLEDKVFYFLFLLKSELVRLGLIRPESKPKSFLLETSSNLKFDS